MSNAFNDTDVLIVGAGPTGLSLAIALASQGVDFLLIDAQQDSAHTSRAVVVHARTLELLEPLNVSERLVERGLKVPLFRARDRDRVLLEVDFSTIESVFNYTLMLPQDQTEAVLRERLRELGVEIHAGVTACHLAQEGGRVSVDLDAGGALHKVSARYVVAADGGHSFVRSAAGIGFEGGTYEQGFVLADVKMSWPLPRDEVTLFFSPDGFMVVAPEPSGGFRTVAALDNPPEQVTMPLIQSLLDERGPQETRGVIGEIGWASRFHVHHRVASRLRAGRILLAGDAAHVHSPAGGQGMNTGIQDSIALAAALGLALAGEENALDAYAERRHRIAAEVVRLTDRMTRAATLENPVARHARNAALFMLGHVPAVERRIAFELSGLGRK